MSLVLEEIKEARLIEVARSGTEKNHLQEEMMTNKNHSSTDFQISNQTNFYFEKVKRIKLPSWSYLRDPQNFSRWEWSMFLMHCIVGAKKKDALFAIAALHFEMINWVNHFSMASMRSSQPLPWPWKAETRIFVMQNFHSLIRYSTMKRTNWLQQII